MANRVELHAAYVFDCDECGRETFGRCRVGEFDEETEREMREEHGIQPWETGDWIQLPSSVVCNHCGAVLEVETYDDI